ncbi:transmembrane protein 176A isoform X1 [Equus caballus]
MSTGMGMVDGGVVAPGGPQPTCIDVHIHQESALGKLLLSGCSLLRPSSQTLGSRRLLVASWAVQIVLGVLSGVLGGFLHFFYYSPVRNSGAAIWTGVVAVLAGTIAFIYEKRGGFYLAQLRTLLALAAFSTATAAVVIGARNFYEYRFESEDICDISPSGSWPTSAPHTPSPEEVRRLHLCLSYLNMLKALFISIRAMLLGVWILLLLASLAPLCLYCWRRLRPKEKRDQKKLLGGNEI